MRHKRRGGRRLQAPNWTANRSQMSYANTGSTFHAACRNEAAQGAPPVLYALDCEMVETAADKRALVRVCVVDAAGQSVLDVRRPLFLNSQAFNIICRAHACGKSPRSRGCGTEEHAAC